MKIFYLNIDELLKIYDLEFLKEFADGREFKSEKRFLQYSAGRFLVKTAAEKIFGISDTKIVIENNKPGFKNKTINFSISHSKNIVAAAFDFYECGLDIEEMKERDFLAIAERYDKKFDTAEEFYKFWTEYEAGIKLQNYKICGKYSCIFLDKFMLAVLSTGEIKDLSISNLLNLQIVNKAGNKVSRNKHT